VETRRSDINISEFWSQNAFIVSHNSQKKQGLYSYRALTSLNKANHGVTTKVDGKNNERRNK
jgi:hypothetical protein